MKQSEKFNETNKLFWKEVKRDDHKNIRIYGSYKKVRRPALGSSC